MEISAQARTTRAKKQKTRDTIIKVALELFAEHGYEADDDRRNRRRRRGIPPNESSPTPTKEDIVFCQLPETRERLGSAARAPRRGDGTRCVA